MNKKFEGGGSSSTLFGSPYTSLEDFPICSGKYENCKFANDGVYCGNGFCIGSLSYGPGDDNHYVISITENNGTSINGLDGYVLNDCQDIGINCTSCDANSIPCPAPDANGKYTAARTYNP